MNDISLNAHSQSNSQSLINRKGLTAYDANRAENLAAGIGSLLLDIPVFTGIGRLSSAVVNGASGIAKTLSSSLVKKYATKGMQAPVAERIVEQALKSKITSRIAGSSATQALTLGGYDAGHSVADDLLLNDGIDVGKAVRAYGKGLATGAAVGLVGTPLKIKSRGLTGGKKLAASAGILGTESAVFTAASEIDKSLSGVDVEPIDLLYDFGESFATLGAMRLAHWRPRGGYAKLNPDGKLKKELSFTKAELDEMKLTGVEPFSFVDKLESALRTGTKETTERIKGIANEYMHMMSSDNLSLSTRAKLLYLVENKISSTYPVPFDYTVEKDTEGNYRLSLVDLNGKRIGSKEGLTDMQVKEELQKVEGNLRRNKIAVYESELLGEYDSDNFFRHAREYARDEGIPVAEVVDAIYKKVNKQPTNSKENSVIDGISQRAGLGDTRVGFMLQELRRSLEKKYELEEGSLLVAVERKTNYNSPAENRALDEYLAGIKKEVETLNKGLDENRIRAIDNRIAESSSSNLGNYEIKLNERRKFLENDISLGRESLPAEAVDNSMVFPIEIPANWGESYAWSVHGIKNTRADMMKLESYAKKYANKIDYDMEFVYDERDIPFNRESIESYNNKVSSLGWYDHKNKKIYINLPNVKDVHELQMTLAHEAVGHKGLSNLVGEYLYDFYEDIYKLASPELKNDLHKFAERNGLTGYAAIEEYVAELAGRNALNAKETSLLNSFKDFVNKMLVKKNLLSPDNDKITTDDLHRFLTSHRRAMQNKIHPDGYRAALLNKFPSLENVTDFYNKDAYNKYMQERYPDKQKALSDTPSLLWNEKRALLEDSNYDIRESNPISYRLIGERGAKRLQESDRYANYLKHATPDKASKLKQNGVDDVSSWRRGGWERGADGKWRTEIGEEELNINDVAGMVLNQKNSTIGGLYKIIKDIPETELTTKQQVFLARLCDRYEDIFSGAEIKLRHLLSDPLLYTAYPNLSEKRVEVSNSIAGSCEYNPKDDILYVTPEALIRDNTLKYDIIPQLQYMIQKEEGFHGKRNLFNIERIGIMQQEYKNALVAIRLINRLKNSPDRQNVYNDCNKNFFLTYMTTPEDFIEQYPTGNDYVLRKLLNEDKSLDSDVEAQNTYKRRFMSATERRKTPPSVSETLTRDKQLSSQGINEIGRMLAGPLDVFERHRMYDLYDIPMILRGQGEGELEIDLNDKFMNQMTKNSSTYDFFNYMRHKYVKKLARETLENDKDYLSRYDNDKKKGYGNSSFSWDAMYSGHNNENPMMGGKWDFLYWPYFTEEELNNTLKRARLMKRYEDGLRKEFDLNSDFNLRDNKYTDEDDELLMN